MWEYVNLLIASFGVIEKGSLRSKSLKNQLESFKKKS